MFNKIKNLVTGKNEKDIVEINSLLEGNTVKLVYMINGIEVDWDSLSKKKKRYYEKLYDKQLLEKQKNYKVKTKPKKALEEYFIDVDEDWLIDALEDWAMYPESHPLLTKWHKEGCPEIKAPKTKDEVEFEEYFSIFGKARKLKESNKEAAIEKYMYILKKYKPTGTSYYTEPAYLFLDLCKFDEAIDCIKIGQKNEKRFNKNNRAKVMKEFQDIIDHIKESQSIFNQILAFLENNPDIIQSKLYKLIDVNGNKARFIIFKMEDAGYLKRSKFKNTYKLNLSK